jgi:hypothetical protein
MTQVLVTETLRTMLYNLSQPLELRDESGQILARVFPMLDLSQYEPLEPQISREEMQRRKQSKGKRYTTAEVLAYLEKL